MTRKIISWLSILIVLLTLLWSCQQEDFSMKEENNKQMVLSSKILHYQDLEKRKAVFSELIKLTKDNRSSKTTRTYTDQENGFSVDLEDCMYLEDPKGQKSYTFTILRDKPEESNPDILENFVLIDKGNDVFESYLFQYEKDVQLNYFMSDEELKRNLTQKVEIFGLGEQKNILATSKIALCVGVMATYVEQPGTSCASGLHTYEDGAACSYWGTVDMALPSYGGHFVYTFDANDCYGGGGAGSAGSGSGTTGPYHGGGSGTGAIQTPCKKAQTTFTKNSGIKTATTSLALQTTNNVEHGFSVMNNVTANSSNPTQALSVGSSGAIDIPLFPSNPYIILAHTHNSPSASTYSVPSWEDMDELSSAIQQNPNFTDVSNLMVITITADGTRYAFMIEDISAYNNYFYKPTAANWDQDLNTKKAKNRNDYYYGDIVNGVKKEPLIKENSTNEEQDLKYFMEIANNAGLNVFELDSNFNTFTQITMTNNQITRIECK